MDMSAPEEQPLRPASKTEQVFYPLEVLKVIPNTSDACSVVLKVAPEFVQQFSYQAGQYLTFEIPWGDFSIRRSYSLCSSPSSDEAPTVTIKRVDGGRASNWFNDRVETGMTLMVAPPAGRFLLRKENTVPIVLAAGGSGITPVLSVIKTALLEGNRDITLIYANRDPESVIFHDQLNELTTRHADRFSCHFHLDSEGEYLTEDKLLTLIDDRWDADFYICGPEVFMDLVENTLLNRNVSKSQIIIERFISPIDPDRVEQTTTETNKLEVTASDHVDFTVLLDGVETTVPYQPDSTLLDSMLACTDLEDVPNSCREGHCGSCMGLLKEGEVNMLENRVLSKRDLAAGYVLACQAIPLTEKILLSYDD